MKIAAFIFFLFFSINTFAKSKTHIHADSLSEVTLPKASGLEKDTAGFQFKNGSVPSKPHKILIVVNGVFYKGDLNRIAPGAIESVNVLKGAKAVSLYGKRGKYGVLVIKMKPNYNIGTLISN